MQILARVELQSYATFGQMWLTNENVCNSLADPANKAKLISLLGGFNNTRELESQLKRISVPPISSEPPCFNDYGVSSALLHSGSAGSHTRTHAPPSVCVSGKPRLLADAADPRSGPSGPRVLDNSNKRKTSCAQRSDYSTTNADQTKRDEGWPGLGGQSSSVEINTEQSVFPLVKVWLLKHVH